MAMSQPSKVKVYYLIEVNPFYFVVETYATLAFLRSERTTRCVGRNAQPSAVVLCQGYRPPTDREDDPHSARTGEHWLAPTGVLRPGSGLRTGRGDFSRQRRTGDVPCTNRPLSPAERPDPTGQTPGGDGRGRVRPGSGRVPVFQPEGVRRVLLALAGRG